VYPALFITNTTMFSFALIMVPSSWIVSAMLPSPVIRTVRPEVGESSERATSTPSVAAVANPMLP
jgi:hypothetical protein